MITPIDSAGRIDIIEVGDQTALICLDVPEVQRIVVEQLYELHYKIHTGLSAEDMLLKMRAHVYDVIIVSAHFNATLIEENPVFLGATRVPPGQRRHQIVVLVGSDFSTGNEMQAFAFSVDLVVGLSDVVNLRPILRRTVEHHREFYAPFHDAEKPTEFA